MESQLEKEARFRQLMAHSSHDSAIDTDSMEWETEVVEFERETVSFLRSFLPVLTLCPPVSQLLVCRFGFPSQGADAPFPTLSELITADGRRDSAGTEREQRGPGGAGGRCVCSGRGADAPSVMVKGQSLRVESQMCLVTALYSVLLLLF